MTTERKYGVSDTQRSMWSCRHKWLMRYGLGLQSPEKPLAPYRGIIWADAMHRLPTDGLDDTLSYLDELELMHLDADTFHTPAEDEIVKATFAEVNCMLRRYVAQYDGDPFAGMTIMQSEHRLMSKVRTPSGRPSTRTDFMGIVDKLVLLNDRLWLLEHKATSMELLKWVDAHSYDPQAPTYAWLEEEYTGQRIHGIIYDLAFTKPLKTADQFETLKDGKRLKKHVGNTTAGEFRAALWRNGLSEEDATTRKGAEWYTETIADLERREDDGWWFHREPVPFDRREVARTAGEIYTIATEIRRARDATKEMRDEMYDVAATGNHDELAEKACGHLRAVAAKFPRNPAMCQTYGRKCRYMDLCRTHQPEAVNDFVIRVRKGEPANEPTEDAEETETDIESPW